MKKLVFLFVVLSLLAFPSQAQAADPRAAVTAVTLSGTDVLIDGIIPNVPKYRDYGWTPYYKVIFNYDTKVMVVTVMRRGKDCPVCGISEPPFVPFSLSVKGYSGYKVWVNGKYYFRIP